MRERIIDQMKPYAQWMVRHGMTWVLVAVHWLVLLPLAVCIEAAKAIPQVWADAKTAHADTMRAAREAKEEKERRA